MIGYSWATEASNEDNDDPDPSVTLIHEYMRRRRWKGPIQLEEPSEAFAEFHCRTGGTALVTALRRGDVLVVPDQSYLFRTASQGLSLIRTMRDRGVSVHCIDHDADITQGKLFEHFVAILSPLARSEPQIKSANARSIKQRDRQRGRYLGGRPPIGYTVVEGGQLAEDDKRRKLMRTVMRLRAKGHSLRAIATELQNRGNRISHSSVRKILRSAEMSSQEDGFPES